MGEARVCVGTITGPQGLGGLLRVKAFTEVPEDVAAYGPVSDEQGRQRFTLTVTGRAKGAVVVRIEGIDDRQRAEALTGTRLYVPRAALPEVEEQETYYHADLIGLAAEDRHGAPLGRVKAVHNFGAGDLLELEEAAPGAGPLMVPFTRAAVPLVDVKAGRLVVEPPTEVESADREDNP